MNKKVFHWLGVLLVVAMFALFGSACSDKDNDDDGGASSDPTGGDSSVVKDDGASSSDSGGGKASGFNKDKFKYVVKMSSPGDVTLMFDYKVDKPRINIKLSTEEGGQKSEIHMISDGKNIYMLEPNSKMAMKMPFDESQLDDMVPDELQFAPDMDEYLKEIDAAGVKPEKKGEETIGGTKVTKYEIKNPDGPGNMILYVADNNLIRKIEISEGDQSFVMEVVEIDTNPTFTDEDFAVPSGYRVMDTGGMTPP